MRLMLALVVLSGLCYSTKDCSCCCHSCRASWLVNTRRLEWMFFFLLPVAFIQARLSGCRQAEPQFCWRLESIGCVCPRYLFYERHTKPKHIGGPLWWILIDYCWFSHFIMVPQYVVMQPANLLTWWMVNGGLHQRAPLPLNRLALVAISSM